MTSGVKGSQARFTVVVVAVATFLAFAPPTAAQEARVRVAVLNFDTYLIEQSEWPYPWAASGLGPLATSLLTSELASHRRFIVIERRFIDELLKEQDLGTSSRVNASTAAQLGQLLGAQVVVVGDVQEFSKKTVGGIGGLARRGLIGGSQKKLSIVLSARMIDAATGEILATSEGKADVSEGALGAITASVGVIVGTELEGEASKVLREAIVKLAENIVDQADGFEIAPMILCLTGSVATVAGGRVYLTLGASTSVAVGDYFKIRDRQEAILDPATGDTLGFVETDKGFVQVAEVQERMSIADVVEGGGFATGQTAARSAAPGDDTQCVHVRGAGPAPESERAPTSAGAEPARAVNAVSPARAAAVPPPAADGFWSGIGDQGGGFTYLVEITISGSTHTIEYPTLGCGGTLTLVNEAGDRRDLDESITTGACANGGRVVLVRSGDQMNFDWFFQGAAQPSVTGTLSRK